MADRFVNNDLAVVATGLGSVAVTLFATFFIVPWVLS